jgi:hypothetical protein
MSNESGKKPSRPNGRGGGNGIAQHGANGLTPEPSISIDDTGIDLSSVESLAAQGLSRDQIFAELGVESEPPPTAQVRVEEAMKKGRALGAARIKKAQYEAALAGSVSAQSHMLELLQEAPRSNAHTVTVRRVVIGGDGDGEQQRD